MCCFFFFSFRLIKNIFLAMKVGSFCRRYKKGPPSHGPWQNFSQSCDEYSSHTVWNTCGPRVQHEWFMIIFSRRRVQESSNIWLTFIAFRLFEQVNSLSIIQYLAYFYCLPALWASEFSFNHPIFGLLLLPSASLSKWILFKSSNSWFTFIAFRLFEQVNSL